MNKIKVGLVLLTFVLMTGIANGLLGYAVGNYIGFLMFNLFGLF